MLRLFAILALFALFSPHRAAAISSNWLHDGPVDVRLLSAVEGVGIKPNVMLGLEVRMEPGWHTYWRAPGASGLPPQIDWSNSQTSSGNLKQATILFPIPRRFNEEGIDTIGYQGTVVFPIDVTLRQPGQSLQVDATLNLLVCSTMCVPKNFNLKLSVPHDSAIEGPEADVINPFLALVPKQNADNGLALRRVINTGESLVFEISSATTLVHPDILVETTPEMPFTPPVWKASADLLGGMLTVAPMDSKKDLHAMAERPLRLTLFDGAKAVEVMTEIPALPGKDKAAQVMTMRAALLLAIIGGFLLNLMPCVLPVLSLKILSFIGHGGKEAAAVRRSFLVTAAGIMFSFFVLASVTVLLKQLGLKLGWGVQFQQPLFLIFLILLLTVFTASMWGLYQINLPHFLAKRLASHHPRMMGDFITGAFATLLATPCTAPFMGTAVGFALASGGAGEIYAIFTALGFGMIIPYFSIALFPEVAIYLPRPGRWMERLRFVLGGFLALTALWLIWILSVQITVPYALTVAICMVGIVCLLGLYSFGIFPLLMKIGIAGFTGVAIAMTVGGQPAVVLDHHEDRWQVFDQAAIPVQVAAGHVVFVDITAEWCLTCKANKKLVLEDKEVSRRLFRSDVIAMQGDWTNPDEAITAFLHSFRRYGIPFNVVYGPNAPQGITLPEVLTRDDVLNALDRASSH